MPAVGSTGTRQSGSVYFHRQNFAPFCLTSAVRWSWSWVSVYLHCLVTFRGVVEYDWRFRREVIISKGCLCCCLQGVLQAPGTQPPAAGAVLWPRRRRRMQRHAPLPSAMRVPHCARAQSAGAHMYMLYMRTPGQAGAQRTLPPTGVQLSPNCLPPHHMHDHRGTRVHVCEQYLICQQCCVHVVFMFGHELPCLVSNLVMLGMQTIV